MANYKLIMLSAKPAHGIVDKTFYVMIADDNQSLTYWVNHPKDGQQFGIITQSEMETYKFNTIDQSAPPPQFLSALLAITTARGHTVELSQIKESPTHLTEDTAFRPLPTGAGAPGVSPASAPEKPLHSSVRGRIVSTPAPEGLSAPTDHSAPQAKLTVNVDEIARQERERQRLLKLAATQEGRQARKTARSTPDKKTLDESLNQYQSDKLKQEVRQFTEQLTTLRKQQKISVADEATARVNLAGMLDAFYQSRTAKEREQITKEYQAIANTMQGHPSTSMKIIGGILATAAAIIVAVLAVIMPPSIIILAPVAAASLLGCGLFGGGFVRNGASKGFNHLIEAAEAEKEKPVAVMG